MSKSETIHIRIDTQTKAKLIEKARSEKRSLSNFLIMAALEYKNKDS